MGERMSASISKSFGGSSSWTLGYDTGKADGSALLAVADHPPSDMCANPFSRLLYVRRRFGGGAFAGTPAPGGRCVSSSSSALTASGRFRFIIVVSNHGWRMCDEGVQVWHEVVIIQSRGARELAELDFNVDESGSCSTS
jgi:hypothetical protein